jgi:hypothetical protein
MPRAASCLHNFFSYARIFCSRRILLDDTRVFGARQDGRVSRDFCDSLVHGFTGEDEGIALQYVRYSSPPVYVLVDHNDWTNRVPSTSRRRSTWALGGCSQGLKPHSKSMPRRKARQGDCGNRKEAPCDGINNPDVSIGPTEPVACCGIGQLGCQMPINPPYLARLLIYTFKRRLFRADRQGRGAKTSLVPRGTTTTPWPGGCPWRHRKCRSSLSSLLGVLGSCVLPQLALHDDTQQTQHDSARVAQRFPASSPVRTARSCTGSMPASRAALMCR